MRKTAWRSPFCCRSSDRGNGATPRRAVVAQDAPRRGRIFGELLGGPHRTARKLAAAVRTGSAEDVCGTVSAKRALEGADHRLSRMRRQVLVAAFAVRPELQHWRLPHLTGSCTVTSLVPSGNVASTCTSWIISATPSITWARDTTCAPA